MIVDDDAEMRALLRDALERDGFDVREDSAISWCRCSSGGRRTPSSWTRKWPG